MVVRARGRRGQMQKGGGRKRGRMVVEKKKAELGKCIGTSRVWGLSSECQGMQLVLRPNFRLNM